MNPSEPHDDVAPIEKQILQPPAPKTAPVAGDNGKEETNAGPSSQSQADPFSTPYGSSPRDSVNGSTSDSQTGSASGSHSRNQPASASSSGLYLPNGEKYFRSRRIKKGEIERPWLEKRDPKEKWVTIIPIIGILVGLGVAGVLIWEGLRAVSQHKYCQVLDEDFSRGLNNKIWTKEVEVGGYGNGQFEMTTNSNENVFIENGRLVIKPTIQDRRLIEKDTVVDLRGHGCTGPRWTDCVTGTNTTNGTIVNPVKSGRINTKLGASIKFGRIEVVAKLPEGDWLWPAIWMLPKKGVYGEWPRSGEIDIMESRGNNYTFGQGGNNIVSSALHFGPNSDNDGWWRNNVKHKVLHTTYSDDFYTFGVEWSEKYIFTYIGTRLMQVMYTHFDEPFWDYGRFPISDANGTRFQNPWAYKNSNTAPFDEDFYLILNVAVGGTNGWFKDGKSGKPWVDTSPTARRDFWQTRDQWYPTWRERGRMEVKSVKMWQQAGYNGCF
ncbi:glycoside hydrolase family 16 protein [Aaosphaeria arxii CBS 175.79]|uniref:Glycoside hydrolase family 16 protein n=1 Tax=Aaosphaeria arxii CBS 175.79 TaxID=1450172 RepID=A0A6A5XWY9_9PLEO|nr:glycoside hydrolase family 16 protein [Aaosphaeria arxii CBS 175.79]KAF2017221.1 glycoside hydrolase family 16 protein [Aaosphaeria arxii CBS 175.79]